MDAIVARKLELELSQNAADVNLPEGDDQKHEEAKANTAALSLARLTSELGLPLTLGHRSCICSVTVHA